MNNLCNLIVRFVQVWRNSKILFFEKKSENYWWLAVESDNEQISKVFVPISDQSKEDKIIWNGQTDLDLCKVDPEVG